MICLQRHVNPTPAYHMTVSVTCPGMRQRRPVRRPYRWVLPAAHRQQPDRVAGRGRRSTDGGHAGEANQFLGSTWLELTVDELAKGWVEDIELVSAGGSKATGKLSFFDQQPQQNLLRDNQAQLSLRIDDGRKNSGIDIRTFEFTEFLASWIERDGRISVVAADGAGDIGSVAFQFNGAACVSLCGFEN